MLFWDILVVSLVSAALGDQKPFWIEDEFPSNSHTYLNNFLNEDNEVVTPFAGITTFAHLPFIHCLRPRYIDEGKEKFDIAIMGAPFDTTVTYRPGYAESEFSDGRARFGPIGIRLGSRRFSKGFNVDSETGFNALDDWATVVDCGDVFTLQRMSNSRHP